MKAFLTTFLCALGFTAGAAVQSVPGGGGGSASSVSVTNIIATSNCVTTVNTNIIVVAGMGGGTNGTFVFANTSPGTWTSVVSRTLAVWHDSTDAFLTNSGGILNTYGGAGDPPVGAWDSGGTTAFDNTTNCYANPLVSLYWSGTMHVDGTNGSNVTAAFGNASLPAATVGHGISNAPNGSAILVRAGIYDNFARTNFGNGGIAGITMHSRTNLELIGIGNPVLRFTNVGDGLLLADCERIRIKGITFAGTHPGGTNWPATSILFIGGILVSNCQHIVIEDCTITNWVGHGIFDISQASTGISDSTNNIVIRNCYFRNTGAWRPADGRYEGGVVAGFAGATVEGCRIDDVARGIEPYPKDASGTGFRRMWVVRNNWIRNTVDHAIFGLLGNNTNLTTVTVEGNTIEQIPGWTFSNGSNELVGATGIYMENIPEVFIKNNLIKNKANGIQLNWNSGIATERAEVTDNRVLGTSAAAYAAGGGGGLYAIAGAGGAGTLQRDVLIARNYFANIQARGMWVALRDSILENNILINCNAGGGNLAAIEVGSYANGTSNVLVRDNIITDKNSTALCDWGISVASGAKAVRLSGNKIENMLQGAITNLAGSGVEHCSGLPVAIVPGLVTNTYISRFDDVLVGMTNSTASVTGRTNKLLDTIIFGHGTLAGYTQTTYDAGGTAAGTNIWLKTVGTQKIYPGGVTETNLSSANYASVTVAIGGPGNTNWIITASYP